MYPEPEPEPPGQLTIFLAIMAIGLAVVLWLGLLVKEYAPPI